MTNYAPTATPRVLKKYVSAGVQHTVQFRRPRDEGLSASLTAARATWAAIYTPLQPLLPADFAEIDELYIPQDTDASSATGYTGPGSIVGAMAVADYTAMKKASALTFSGKSAHSKTKIEVFGVFFDLEDPAGPAANGIITSAEVAAVGTVVTSLNGGAATYAIDGAIATFRNQATYKVNDNLLKLVRRGTIS